MEPPRVPKEGGSGTSSSLVLHFAHPQHGEEVSPAASDLAMVLTRGLSLEHQKSSRDSLQYSSGYSTQTTTPSCSEDTIPSQGGPRGVPQAECVCWAFTAPGPTQPWTPGMMVPQTRPTFPLSVSLE